jgi:protoporphyrinogen/coproporphyrinogen III oxidase
MTTIAIIGGGITGLAAALQVARQDPNASIVVLEAAATVGGKLGVGPLGPLTVDLGAESLLNTRPEATALAHDAGLSEAIVHPATSSAGVLSRGHLRPLPGALVMGLPSDVEALVRSGVLDDDAVELVRRGLDSPVTSLDRDTGIGAFAAERLGADVADRLVDPILAGVYAGDAATISLRAAAPSLDAALTNAAPGSTLGTALAAARRSPVGPVFAGLVGGVGSLPAAVEQALVASGVQVRTSTAVTALAPAPGGGWTVTAQRVLVDEDDERDVLELTVDRLLLAVPAYAAEQLLSTLPERSLPLAAFDALRGLAAIPYADVAVGSFAFPLDVMPPASGSGFLVPSVERRFIKAATFSSNKWEWSGDAAARAGLFVLRASAGRFGDSVEALPDDTVLDRMLADLGDLLPGLPTAAHRRLDRWAASLPQYVVGHPDRVATIRRGLSRLPGLEVAGAAYDGIGIAACIASGQRAAERLLAS